MGVEPQRLWVTSPAPQGFISRLSEVAQQTYQRKAISTLCRYLGNAVKAGITPEDALAAFRKACPSEAVAVFRELEGVLRQPHFSLSHALLAVGGNVSPVFVALVRAGERHGRWDYVLGALAEYTEREWALVFKRLRAVAAVTVLFAVAQALNIVYAAVLSSGLGLKVLLLAAGLILGLKGLRKQISVVATQKLLAKRLLAHAAYTLGLLLQAGVPPSEALEVIAETVGSQLSDLDKGIREVAGQVRRGMSLSQTLSTVPGVPHEIIQAVALGERTGTVDEHLQKVAVALEQEAESAEQRWVMVSVVTSYLAVGLLWVFIGIVALVGSVLLLSPLRR
ncbi:hypothetical protein HRbin17_00689 [bacterium HR17]|uniref:Type II secretion system protein GspF domain-containing protein n=1 Tax=Candidatus Fervidibacter japonicus TaxID=2035412 RepID=A0A2H5XAH1_9BACT|nr:hypothetical protein HRbin17_00689 [bacterium HR17]